jgi:hypothetical protein
MDFLKALSAGLYRYCSLPVVIAVLQKRSSPAPNGYNLRTAYETKLPLELDEISGVAFYAGDSSVFAINDEKGWLYKLKKGQPIKRWKFSGGADFEDVVLLDSLFYVLQSNGNILRLSFATKQGRRSAIPVSPGRRQK